MPRGKTWSKEEDRALKRLHKEGKTISEITKEMGRVYKSVQGRMRRFNLKPNKSIEKWVESRRKKRGSEQRLIIAEGELAIDALLVLLRKDIIIVLGGK